MLVFRIFAGCCAGFFSGVFKKAYNVVKRFRKHDFIFSEMYRADRALELLRKATNQPNAEFHDGQEEAIRHVVNGRGRLLVVQKTGWGKSFIYFIATKLLREAGMGPALLVSPLLALMRNQIAAAERMGIRAETINSDNEKRWIEAENAIRRDEVDILLISPERLANERFNQEVLAVIAARISLLVIDEAHCISDWGHDFRPDYRRIEQRYVKNLTPKDRLLATTATANDRVIKDLKEVLGPNLEISRGDLARSSLFLQTIRLPGQAERLAWLAERLPKMQGNGIVYTLTVRDAGTVADWLRFRGLEVESYTSETKDREKLEQALLDNKVKALVATTALGMGFDKPDLAFVIHYQTPGSVVAYYQQVGRAGRSLDAAYGVLLSGREDTEITDYFIKSAFPTPDEVQQILEALEANREGLSGREIETKVNVRAGRIKKTIQLLSLESPAPIAKQEAKWQLTAATLIDDFWERVDRITRLRLEEQQQMQEYVGLSSGHMEFLIRALDGEPGNFLPPEVPALPASTDPACVREAVDFLRGSSLQVEPRRRWPPGKMIDPEHRAEPGRALCVWGDSGWGTLVRQGKYRDNRFSDQLVNACVVLMREWRPDPFPEWATAVPSSRRPELVPDFARRLAHALRLPFREALTKKEPRPEQKTMENSDKQARNVLGSLAIDEGTILPEPVLLVDDMVDSRWTFTVVAWELRRRGGGKVWPLALAQARGG